MQLMTSHNIRLPVGTESQTRLRRMSAGKLKPEVTVHFYVGRLDLVTLIRLITVRPVVIT